MRVTHPLLFSMALLFAVATALPAAGPVSAIESGLGTEFQAGDTFGLLSEDGTRPQGIWAGTTCIFR